MPSIARRSLIAPRRRRHPQILFAAFAIASTSSSAMSP
jgi:hypothetical protein